MRLSSLGFRAIDLHRSLTARFVFKSGRIRQGEFVLRWSASSFEVLLGLRRIAYAPATTPPTAQPIATPSPATPYQPLAFGTSPRSAYVTDPANMHPDATTSANHNGLFPRIYAPMNTRKRVSVLNLS